MTKKSIREREARSASDKVLKNNIGKINQLILTEAFVSWTPENIALAEKYRERYGDLDDELWRQHVSNIERIKKKKTDAKNKRVIDWD